MVLVGFGIGSQALSSLTRGKGELQQTSIRWRCANPKILRNILSDRDEVKTGTDCHCELPRRPSTHRGVGNGWCDGGKTKALLQFVFMGLKQTFYQE